MGYIESQPDTRISFLYVGHSTMDTPNNPITKTVLVEDSHVARIMAEFRYLEYNPHYHEIFPQSGHRSGGEIVQLTMSTAKSTSQNE